MSKFDNYTILKMLGKGSYAKVYNAIDTTTNSQVALKIIKCKEDEGIHTSIFKELSILKICKTYNHPHIICINDMFVHDNKIYIDMMKADSDLFDVLRDAKKPLPYETIKKYSFQIIDAMTFLHSKNIIYRDIKSENILVKNGNLYLIDFNLARFSHGSRFSPNPCTCNYKPPEILENKKNCYYDGEKLDVWTIGCLLYELVKTRTLFRGDSKDQVFKIQKIILHQREDCHNIYEFWKNKLNYDNLPDEYIDLIDKSLQLIPSKRVSCQELLNMPIFKEYNPTLYTKELEFTEKFTNSLKIGGEKDFDKQLLKNIKSKYKKIYRSTSYFDDAIKYAKTIYNKCSELVCDDELLQYTCIIIAAKLNVHHYYDNETWCEFCKLSPSDIIELEFEILEHLDFQVYF